jgi:hypothetical protein
VKGGDLMKLKAYGLVLTLLTLAGVLATTGWGP